MAYVKQTWQDNPPSATTPISAERLNHLETQYDEAVATLEPAVSDLSDTVNTGRLSETELITTIDGRIDAKYAIINGVTTEALLPGMPPGIYIVEP